MPEYFANVKPTTPAGEQRVLGDVMFLSESLERLRGVKAANLEAHFRGRFRLPRCGAVEAESSLSLLSLVFERRSLLYCYCSSKFQVLSTAHGQAG